MLYEYWFIVNNNNNNEIKKIDRDAPPKRFRIACIAVRYINNLPIRIIYSTSYRMVQNIMARRVNYDSE